MALAVRQRQGPAGDRAVVDEPRRHERERQEQRRKAEGAASPGRCGEDEEPERRRHDQRGDAERRREREEQGRRPHPAPEERDEPPGDGRGGRQLRVDLPDLLEHDRDAAEQERRRHPEGPISVRLLQIRQARAEHVRPGHRERKEREDERVRDRARHAEHLPGEREQRHEDGRVGEVGVADDEGAKVGGEEIAGRRDREHRRVPVVRERARRPPDPDRVRENRRQDRPVDEPRAARGVQGWVLVIWARVIPSSPGPPPRDRPAERTSWAPAPAPRSSSAPAAPRPGRRAP